MTIGERAAQAIRNRREVLGTLSAAFKEINLTRDVFDGWDKKDRNPSAYWLQQMALAGYDTHLILTGEQKAEAGDVARGYWVRLDEHKGEANFKCSICRSECYVPTCMGDPMYDFCPYCGKPVSGERKMDG